MRKEGVTMTSRYASEKRRNEDEKKKRTRRGV